MCGCMVDIQSAKAENSLGEEKKKKPQGKNIMSASVTQGSHNQQVDQKAQLWLSYLCIKLKLLGSC